MDERLKDIITCQFISQAFAFLKSLGATAEEIATGYNAYLKFEEVSEVACLRRFSGNYEDAESTMRIHPNAINSRFMPKSAKLEILQVLAKGPEPKKPKKPRRAGFVYLMRNHRNGYTKIGFSGNPTHREATLQAQEPEVQLIAKWPGTIADEEALHKRYAANHVRGEWYALTHRQRLAIIRQHGGGK